MKVKTYFSTFAFLFFFPPTEFLKIGINTHPIDLFKNLKKIHRPEAEILAHKVGKYEKVTDN